MYLKKFSGIIACLAILTAIPFCLTGCKKDTSAVQSNAVLSTESEEERLAREKEAAREKFLSDYAPGYDAAAEAYNAEVDKINSFLDKIQSFDLFELTTPLVTKALISDDFDSFWDSGVDFDNLSADTEKMLSETPELHAQYYDICKTAYLCMIDEYNTVANAYNNLLTTTSVVYIKDMPHSVPLKDQITYDISEETGSEDKLISDMNALNGYINNLTQKYIIAEQITVPDESFVMTALKNVPSITACQAVSEDNDPNELLGTEEGYVSCVYFTCDKIGYNDVEGNNIVEKGTNGGGAIEVYPDVGAALARCQYLSDFDNSLLYSGSYAIIGTMVVRTSYLLTNSEQLELTDAIVKSLTTIQ